MISGVGIIIMRAFARALLLLLVLCAAALRASATTPCTLDAARGSECHPEWYPLDQNNNATCYCTDYSETWGGGGSWCGGNCVKHACGSPTCGCSCGGGGLPDCHSEIDSSQNGCYKGVVACAACDAGSERQGCGCSVNGHLSYTCAPGSCVACAAGQTYSVGGIGARCTLCRQCSGAYAQGWNQTAACTLTTDAQFVPCPPGQQCLGCVASTCPVNYYCAGGSAMALYCDTAKGLQCFQTGMSAPVRACLAGAYYDAGSASCLQCPAGSACPGGAYGAATANACPAGAFAAAGGSSACTLCPAGSWNDGSGFSHCLLCTAGTYQTAAGQTACAACAAGSFMPTPGAAYGCILCLPGASLAAVGSRADHCDPCPLGAYAPAQGASACTPCPATTTTLAAGAMGVESCVACTANRYWSAGACIECLAYDPSQPPVVNAVFCRGDGTSLPRVQPVRGVTYVAAIGGPMSDNGLAPCSACVAGATYVRVGCDLLSDTQCAPCSAPTALSYVVAPCTPTSDTRLADCAPADLEPGAVCNPCPPGTTTGASAASGGAGGGAACVACPAGTYKAAVGAGACVACPAGTLSPAGASWCAVNCSSAAAVGGALGSSQGFAPDGRTCLAALTQLPWRTLGQTPATMPQAGIVALAGLPGSGTDEEDLLFAATESGVIWRLSPGGNNNAWLAAGGAATVGDGLGAAAGLPQGPLMWFVAIGPTTLLLASAASAALRLLEYDPVWGVLRVSTQPATPGLALVHPMGLMLGDDALFIADAGAHCVWALGAGGAQRWRGTGTPSPLAPSAPASGAVWGDPAEWRLASPSALARVDAPQLGPDASAWGLVLDARAVWAFDITSQGPSQTPADLAYVCGTTAAGGTVPTPSQPLPCASLAVAALQPQLAVHGRLLFLLLSPSASSAGAVVLVVELQRVVATMVVRVLIQQQQQTASSPTAIALAPTTGALWVGFGAEARVYATGAIQHLEPAPALGCVCAAGLYCPAQGGQACLPAPAGTYAPAWASAPTPCRAGTLLRGGACVACPNPAQYTTYAPGAYVCSRRCVDGQLFHDGECVPGCNASRGEYLTLAQSGSGEQCALCPLGTGAVVGAGGAGVLAGCAPCQPPGEYGALPGRCELCPSGTATALPGATQCAPCGVGMRGAAGAEGGCEVIGVAGGGVLSVAGSQGGEGCVDDDGSGQAGVCQTTIEKAPAAPAGAARLLAATVAGALWAAAYEAEGAGLPTTLTLIESNADGTTLFAAAAGGSCVWRGASAAGAAAVYAGDCAEAGDTDGAPASGIARLGPIVGLAHMEVEGATPALFVSTAGACPTIRAVSLYDGGLTTRVGSDATRLPVLLRTDCPAAPYVIAVARGASTLLFATGADVWALDALGVSQRLATVGARVTALCAQSALWGALALIASADGAVTFLPAGGAPRPLLLAPQAPAAPSNNASAAVVVTFLASAGRRWWFSGAGGAGGGGGAAVVYTAGFGASVLPQGCVGGYIVSPGGACAQVGLGSYLLADGLMACKAGTYGVRAGGVSHASACAPCPAGSYAPEGAVGCDPCPATRPLALGGACVAGCPDGFFLSSPSASPSSTTPSASPSAMTCTACPPGTTAAAGAQGAAECAACPAGQYVNASTAWRCAACPAGWTSRAGSFRCVPICPVGTCSSAGGAGGAACEPLTRNWEILTMVQIAGGPTMHAVAVGGGGDIFYTDGSALLYFLDDCPESTHVADVCQRAGTSLLPPLVCPSCVRGFSALALAHGFALPGVRLLYAASASTHSIYRLPILFTNGSSVLVDAAGTAAMYLLSSSQAAALAAGGAAQAAYAAFFLLDSGGAAGDRTGLAGWRLIGGASGASGGFLDGAFAVARLNMPSELELDAADRHLYISDFANHRVRVADLVAGTVGTVLGTGAGCWSYGTACGGATSGGGGAGCGGGCASAQTPLGIGLSPDGARLFVTQNAIDAVGVVDLASGTFAPFCALNFDNAAQYTHQSCSQDAGSRTCMLYAPFDVLASAGGAIYVAATHALTVIDATTLACEQEGGAPWAFWNSAGHRDGEVVPVTGPTSLLNRPFKLALDPLRGILYIADYSNGALRRVFVDGACRCAEGALFIPEAQVCALAAR